MNDNWYAPVTRTHWDLHVWGHCGELKTALHFDYVDWYTLICEMDDNYVYVSVVCVKCVRVWACVHLCD